jgi:polyisoprenoid-binding protein YceI
MTRPLSLAAAVVALALPSLARAATYEIDALHSNLGFKVRHLMVSWVHGKFEKGTGTISYDKANPAATTIQATLDAATINTGDAERDKHLRSADFFEVEKFPAVEFKSKKAEPDGARVKVTGDLTMHGVTKEVVLDVEGITEPVKDPWGNVKVGATATTRISRKEFGLSWNKALEAGGVTVGDEVLITLDIEAAQRPEPAKADGKAPAKTTKPAKAGKK